MTAPTSPCLWRSDHRVRFIDQVCADLSLPAGACRLAVALSRFVNSRTLLCWPTQKALAELVGLKERQVRNILDALAAAGHLQVIPITSTRSRDERRNGYRIIMKDAGASSQGTKDEENQCAGDTDVLPELYDENEPTEPDTGNGLPLNTGNGLPLNTGNGLPVNKEEENPLEFNPLALQEFQRERKRAQISLHPRARRLEVAFGRRAEPPNFSHAPTLSPALRAKLGLPEPHPPPAAVAAE